MRYVIALSAALIAFGSLGSSAQAAEGKFCLTQAKSQAKNCSYESMAQCMKSKTAPSDDCSPYNGTTGSGAGSRGMKSN